MSYVHCELALNEVFNHYILACLSALMTSLLLGDYLLHVLTFMMY